MTTEAINHDPAHMFMNTGSQIAGRRLRWDPGHFTAWGGERGLPARGSSSDFARSWRTEPADRRSPVVARASSPVATRGHLRRPGDAVLYLGNPPG